MADLGPNDHVGEASDTLGFFGNIVQTLDQGASIFGRGGGLGGGGFLPGSELSFANGSGTTTPFFNETAGVQRGFNGLGAVTGALSAVQGWNDMTDDKKSTADRVAGAGNVFSGGVGAIGGVAGVINPSMTGFFGGLAQAGGSMGLGADVLAGSTWGAGAGAAGVGTALASTAAVVGAGTAGYGIGRYGDQNMENLGWMGKGADGKNNSISDKIWDWSSGAADKVEGWTGSSGLGTAAGCLTNLGASAVVGVPAAIASTAMGLGGAASSFNNALGGVPGQVLDSATGGLAGTFGRGLGAAGDMANWLLK
jgi:hypothetical protein